MEIHKPKAAHSGREFAVEIGTIICGILIALGLEQAVEWSHMRREISETREALRAEIANAGATALIAASADRCLLATADRHIAWAQGGPRPEFSTIPHPNIFSTVWDASRSGPALRMPTHERLEYAEFYGLIQDERIFGDKLEEYYSRDVRYANFSQLNPSQVVTLVEDLTSEKLVLATDIVDNANIVRLARKFSPNLPEVPKYWRDTVEKACTASGAPAPQFREDQSPQQAMAEYRSTVWEKKLKPDLRGAQRAAKPEMGPKLQR